MVYYIIKNCKVINYDFLVFHYNYTIYGSIIILGDSYYYYL